MNSNRFLLQTKSKEDNGDEFGGKKMKNAEEFKEKASSEKLREVREF